MLSENIKKLRKQKGLTQEELAVRLNVVRQTVSKWEKGISVPDAVLLEKIADILDTNVSTLLGKTVEPESDSTQIAEQLARISEQLAIKNRRWHIFWKVFGISAAIILLLNVVLVIAGGYAYQEITEQADVTVYNESVE